ncbi:MAG TPA: CPBP family intramembrane glutamic endopeptidase [Blastocatellia bacterium]|nr:CPBP family intramembrane glutamic endopeptidase [Blastocatellia bacterium]
MKPQPALSPSNNTHRQESLAPALELLCLITLVITIEWVVPFTTDPRIAYQGLAFLILLLLLVCQLRDRASARDLGIRFDNFTRVLFHILLPFLIFLIAVIATGAAFGTLRFESKFYSMWLSVPPWALLQQYMLFGFAMPRLKRIVGNDNHVVATAVLFSILHLPNPVLTIVCAIGAYIWAREYDREPNLLANAVTHTVASVFLANALPGWLLKNMVVGYNYFTK